MAARAPEAPAAPDAEARVRVGQARIHLCTLAGATERIVAHALARGRPEFVVTPNTHHLVLLEEDARFRDAYAAAWLVVPDSVPLVWATRLLGEPLPERVNGTDLFEAVCAAGGPRGLRVFLMGGRPGAAERAGERLRERFPGLVIAGTSCPPFGFEHDAAASEAEVQAVRRAAPDVLFVALGAPKQELWMLDHRERAGVPVSVGVGGSFEFVSGVIRRAPRPMQRAGLEWLWRLVHEPRRLWRRYARTIPAFLRLVVLQYLHDR